MSFESFFILAAIAVTTGCLATVGFFVSLRRSPSSSRTPSALRYFAFAALIAFIAYSLGSMLGIYGACSSPKSGNLCGLWGALGFGPLLAGISLWAYGPAYRRLVNK